MKSFTDTSASGSGFPPATRLYRGLLRALGPIVRGYSRVELRGRENLPAGGAILVSNHPGSLWWDAVCLAAALAPRPIAFVANAWDFRNPLMGHLLHCVGAIPQADVVNRDDAAVDRARRGSLVCHFAEQAYHTFRRRYTVYRFAPQTLAYSRLAQVPVVPTAVVGVEEAAATLAGFKRAGMPFHFPVVPPIVLPIKVIVEFGAPLSASELTDNSTDDAFAGRAAARRLQDAVAALLAKQRRVRTSDEDYLQHAGWW